MSKVRKLKTSRKPHNKRGVPLMNVLNAIEHRHYSATEQQIEVLANQRWTAGIQAQHIDGTYLRILVAAVQHRLGTKTRKRPPVKIQRDALDEASQKFYPAVLRGITTPDVEPDPEARQEEQTRRALERNRRTTFARTAKATLVAFVAAGGDLRGLNVMETTKNALRAFAAGKTVSQARIERGLGRAQDSFLRLIRQEAEKAPELAREHLARLMDLIAAELETMAPATRRVRKVVAVPRPASTKRNKPTLVPPLAAAH